MIRNLNEWYNNNYNNNKKFKGILIWIKIFNQNIRGTLWKKITNKINKMHEYIKKNNNLKILR